MANELKESQKKFYSCSICGYKTPRISDLKKHKEIHLAVYRCSTCSYQTPYKFSLKRHKEIHMAAEERRLFVCAHCDKKYMSKRTLRDHLHNDHTDSRAKGLKESQKKVYRCSACSYKTPHKSLFTRHKKIHLAPEKRQWFACVHCDQKYKTKKSLQDHLHNDPTDSRANESQKKVYRCSTCGYKTPNKCILNRHKKIHLAPEEQQWKKSQKKVYTCSTCSYNTPYEHYLNRHKKIHLALEGRQLFACAHCDKKYLIKRRLQEHFHIHHTDSRAKEWQEKVYRCSTCDFKTLHKRSLNRHKNIHLVLEEQLLTCSHCDKKYTGKSGLKYHLENNHVDPKAKESQIKVYRCSTCSYKTPHRCVFTRHKKTHLAPEERQMFACAHCDKKYTRKLRLRYHLQHNHIDSRNFDCTSVTDEVILDSLKIEIDDHTPLKDEFKYAESATSEEKSECFLKIEPDDVTPILNNDMHHDFQNAENLPAPKKVKLEDFIKMEPDDDSPFLDEDAFFKQENIHNF